MYRSCVRTREIRKAVPIRMRTAVILVELLFFRGTGGFVAAPTNGRSIEVTIERGEESVTETLYARADGLVVQLLNDPLCAGSFWSAS